MGVYKRSLANGGHVYRVGVWFNGKTHFETAGTDKRAAERLDKQRKREVAAGTYVPKGEVSGSTTILDYAADWFEARGNGTKLDDAQRMRDHILPRVGSTKLQDLTRTDVKELIKALIAQDQTISIKTAKNAFGVFRTMMQEAFDSDLITRDPCGRLPRGTWPSDAAAGEKGKQQREIYPREDVVRLTTSERLSPGVLVLDNIFFYTGARQGEGCGLTWRQWTRDSLPLGALAIDWQYDHKPLKQAGQPRRVPVHPVLADVLGWWWSEGFALTYGRAPNLDDFIVPRLNPGRWDQGRILGARSECHTKSSSYKAFTRACERLGIEGRTLHSTRHTMITASRRGDPTGRLKAPLERVTHNAKGEIIDCYTHWEWEPLCEAILAINYAPATPAVRGEPPVARGALPAAKPVAPLRALDSCLFVSNSGAGVCHEVCHASQDPRNHSTKQWRRRESNPTHSPRFLVQNHESSCQSPSDRSSNSRQIAQVDAHFAARQTSAEDAAQNYLVAGSRGEPCADLALRLAAAVMSEPRVQLAMTVLSGGAHAESRATDLAALVLTATAPPNVTSLDSARKRRDEGSGK